jgi:glutamate-1-semialdehyde 2,1-aminomutase
MLTVYFSSAPVTDYASALACDREAFARVHSELLRRGVFWPPSAFESVFLSVRHQPSDVDRLVSAFDAGLAALPSG